MSTFLILLEYWSPVSLNFGRNLKKQKNHCFSSIGWFFDQIALKQKSRKANMLCRSFSVLEIFETSPSFHIKLFFNLQWRSKNGLFEVCTLRHLICSSQLEYFSHQSSLAVWNVNPSLFHYIMQKMIWCLEKAYFDGRYIILKNPHTFFFSKIKYT